MRLEDDLDSKAALVDLLNYLCKQLEKKDTNMVSIHISYYKVTNKVR